VDAELGGSEAAVAPFGADAYLQVGRARAELFRPPGPPILVFTPMTL
jgi:hypothetical protein